VCIVSPQRLGLCGAYNWLDCKASNQINPTGPNQPVQKGKVIDPVKGYWTGTNENAVKNSQGTVTDVALYSIMESPMTACGCFECIVMYLPETEGVMVVSREDPSMTPAGMTFSTLAGMAGGGLQTPGVMGIGKFYLTSPKFISADGGFKRVVWMSSFLKDSMAAEFAAVAEREGIPNLIDLIADERKVTAVDELVDWVEEVKHPVLEMGVMQAASGEVEEEVEEEVEAAAPVAEKPKAEAPKVEAVKEPEPVVEVAPAPEPVAAAPVPVAIPQLPADASTAAIVQATSDIVLGSIRRALEAALVELGGTPPVAPAAPVAAAPPVAEAVVVEEKVKLERVVVPPWSADGESLDFAKEKWMGSIREVTLGATADEGGTRTSTVA
ncbi:MAG: hypothetical protein GY842_06725, partial [bacterium]|nr:hypothetical protein [bacterium]